MSWLFSRALVAAYSGGNSWDGGRSVRSSNPPQEPLFYAADKMTGFSKPSRFGQMCGLLTASHGAALLMWFQAGLPARGSRPLEKVPGWMTREVDSSSKCCASLPRFDLASCSWRTHPSSGAKDLHWSSVNLPKSGMMRGGILSLRPEWERHISGGGSGLWPTLSKTNAHGNGYTRDGGKKGKERLTLPGMVKAGMLPTLSKSMATRGDCPSERNRRTPGLMSLLPTLCKRDYRAPNSPDGASRRKRAMKNAGKQLPNELGQSLTPTFCEWFMGFPLGWTELKPLETRKFREWSKKHGGG